MRREQRGMVKPRLWHGELSVQDRHPPSHVQLSETIKAGTWDSLFTKPAREKQVEM